MSKLCIPEKILDQHLVVLGKTGKGKSSVLRYLVEHLLDQKKRVVIIDPKGDWWGLKVSADGKSAGYPVIAFGGFKEATATDVPLNDRSGGHVAELIATGNRPAIIGLRGWMPAQMTRFWIEFASTLFNKNEGELYLVIDEVQNFAPKGAILSPQAGECLHWTNRVLAEGRGLGIVTMIASQRPQKVHNDTLTACETLIGMGVNHPKDREAVAEWIDGCGDKEQGKMVLTSIAKLPRGEGYVWSPDNGFGPVRVKFPLFGTFDSFAPPQLQKKVSSKSWADVDLAVITAKLSAVIEEAKANDPKFLKAEVDRLKRELAKAPSKVAPAEIKIQEVPVFSKDEHSSLKEAIEIMSSLKGPLLDVGKILDDIGRIAAKRFINPVSSERPVSTPRWTDPRDRVLIDAALSKPTAAAARSADGLGKCETAILRVLANYEDTGCQMGKLALLSGYRESGGFRNSLSQLRTSGMIVGENGGSMIITDAGMKYGPFESLPSGRALQEYWLNHPSLGKCERAVLGSLINRSPQDMPQLCASTGYTESGGFRNALSCLRTAGLITGQNRGEMSAIDDLL